MHLRTAGPFVPERYHFAPGVAAIMVGFGTPEEHAAAVAPLREALDPQFEAVMPIPYLALQQMLDEGTFWGVRAYTKGLYLDELLDDAVEVIAERLPGRTSPLSELLSFPFGGGYAEVGDDDTAFGGAHDLKYVVAIEGMAPDAATLEKDRQWVRETWDALRPAATGPGAYVDLMAEVDDHTLRATYGCGKDDRLARIKAEYDPGDVSHATADIKPS